MTFAIRAIEEGDRERARDLIRERWRDDIVVAHGVVFQPATLPGFFALDRSGTVVGLVTYAVQSEACEIVTIDALTEGRGVGRALVTAVTDAARRVGCRRIELVTTNDNERARGFYRRLGFVVVEVREGALEGSRLLKPSIPLVNDAGVPIRDEIALVLELEPDRDRYHQHQPTEGADLDADRDLARPDLGPEGVPGPSDRPPG
jgi:ribosomal protein S18 acetylase RimI-like enzyme